MTRDDYVHDGRPLQVGTEEQLLLDDYLIEDRFGLQRRYFGPTKHPRNPILSADKPWEVEGMVYDPRVIFDREAGLFRMWYACASDRAFRAQMQAQQWDPARHGYPYFMCYAESPDGVNWSKPELGLIAFCGWEKTNIVLTGKVQSSRPTVVEAPQEMWPERRFIAIYSDGWWGTDYGVCFAYSADGVHWAPDPANPVINHDRDSCHSLAYSQRLRKWFLYLRPAVWATEGYTGGHPASPWSQGGDEDFGWCRSVAVTTSDDLKHWSYPREVLTPDEHSGMEFEGMYVYPQGSHFIGLLQQKDWRTLSKQITYLATSPDGVNWSYPLDREPFLPNGPEGAFDSGQLLAPASLLEIDGKLYFYYAGVIQTEQATGVAIGGIGLAQMWAGRYCAQVGDDHGGHLITRELIAGGDRLLVNIAGRPERAHGTYGEWRAELLERPQGPADHRPARIIEGYSFFDCRSYSAWDTGREVMVEWNGSPDIGKLRGKPIYLRFFLRDQMLFGFRFADAVTL